MIMFPFCYYFIFFLELTFAFSFSSFCFLCNYHYFISKSYHMTLKLLSPWSYASYNLSVLCSRTLLSPYSFWIGCSLNSKVSLEPRILFFSFFFFGVMEGFLSLLSCVWTHGCCTARNNTQSHHWTVQIVTTIPPYTPPFCASTSCCLVLRILGIRWYTHTQQGRYCLNSRKNCLEEGGG